MALVLDTGPLFASLDRTDADHAACRALIEETKEARIIPAPVLPEVDYWIAHRLRPTDRLGFLDDILGGFFQVEALTAVDYSRIREICERYGDTPLGFVDAAVLAVVERLGEPKLATLDRRHFGLLRPRHVHALILLPE